MKVALVFIHDMSGSMEKKSLESAKEIINDAPFDFKSLKIINIPFNNVVGKVEMLEYDEFKNYIVSEDCYTGLCNINIAFQECERQVKQHGENFDKILILLATANNITCTVNNDAFNDFLQLLGNKIFVLICNYGRKPILVNIHNANIIDCEFLDGENVGLNKFYNKILTFISNNDNS